MLLADLDAGCPAGENAPQDLQPGPPAERLGHENADAAGRQSPRWLERLFKPFLQVVRTVAEPFDRGRHARVRHLRVLFEDPERLGEAFEGGPGDVACAFAAVLLGRRDRRADVARRVARLKHRPRIKRRQGGPEVVAQAFQRLGQIGPLQGEARRLLRDAERLTRPVRVGVEDAVHGLTIGLRHRAPL